MTFTCIQFDRMKDTIVGHYNCVHPHVGDIGEGARTLTPSYYSDSVFYIGKNAPSEFVQHSAHGGHIDFSGFPPGWTYSMAPPYPSHYIFDPWDGNPANDMLNTWGVDLSVLATPPFCTRVKRT